MKTLCFSLFLLIVVSGLFTSTALSQVYELTDLGTFTPQSINDSGQVVGYYWAGGDYQRAYLWENGSTRDIGVPPSGGYSYGTAINNSGRIVGRFWPQNNYSQAHAFFWENGIMTDLGTFGGSSSTALGINDSNKVVGVAYFLGDTINHGFLWQSGVMTDLGTLGGDHSNAYSVNDSDQVVGYGTLLPTNDSPVHAFIWEDGVMSDLGTLGGKTSLATAINDYGHVIGYSSTSSFGAEGFIWQNGGMTSLGAIDPPPGSPVGTAIPSDINDSDIVVGSSTWNNPPGTEYTHAFVWENGTMTDLNAVTDTSGGWRLIRGSGINNHGDIVGLAFHNGQQQGFLLKKKGILLTNPKGGEFWISGENNTIRWKSGLPPGANIVLELSLDSGKTWKFLADSEKYTWTVPDTFSAKARILISDAADFTVNDTNKVFKFRGYVLTKLSPSGDYIVYNPVNDYWRFKNDSLDNWRPSWYSRFNYDGIDPLTGQNYQSGERTTDRIFALAQSSDFPDWQSFARAFGVSPCYLNITNAIYSPTAVIKWESMKKPFKGACFGMSLSNAFAFRYPEVFRGRYPDLPDFSIPFLVDPDSSILPVIHELYSHQLGQPHKRYRKEVASLKIPTQTLNELKAMLIDEYEPVRTLTLKNNGDGGGSHSVLPYKLISDDVIDGSFQVFIYDSNDPTSYTSEILISTTHNNGDGIWTASGYSGWDGTKGLYLMNPVIDYRYTPTLQKISPESQSSPFILAVNELNIHINGEAEVVIGDTNGNVTGYIDSLVHDDIPGSAALIVDNGSKTPPYGYALPLNPYSVTVREFAEQESRAYFFTGNKIFSVERTGADSGQTDRLFFDGGLSVANPDTAAKTFSLFNIINEFEREKVISIGSLTLSENDSVKIQNINTDGLKLSSFDATLKSYILSLELVAFTGIKRFTHNVISLSGNSSHIIQPNWPGLDGGDLKILIDNGNDGTIDDSMLVNNQVTGVHDGSDNGIPSAFALHQNYPNPFNPVTTIEYAVPSTSHVTLKIFDVLGREVATLVNRIQSPGVYTAVWEGTDIPAGVYFYRLTAGSFTSVKKMLLVK